MLQCFFPGFFHYLDLGRYRMIWILNIYNNHDDWIDYLFLYATMWNLLMASIVIPGNRTACTVQDNSIICTFYSVGEVIF